MTDKTPNRAVSATGEGPATAETTYPLLVPSRQLCVWEARGIINLIYPPIPKSGASAPIES